MPKNLAVQHVYTIMTLNTFKALQQGNSSKSDTHSRATQTVIYLITCANCKKQYVGKTTRTLRYRVCQHRHSIKKPICGIGENRPSGAKTQKKSYLYHVVALTLLYLSVLLALQSVLLFPSYKGKRFDH